MGDRNHRSHTAPAGAFVPPRITDLGGLVELTRTADLFFGHVSGASDLSFSGAVTPEHGSVAPFNGASEPGGGGAVSGAGGAVGAGGQLPFTGYSVTIVAAMGSVISAAGVAIRRALTRWD